MRVVTQHEFGGPEVLRVVEMLAPTPGPGEVRVATSAIGVNPVDAVVRSGRFPLLGLPPFTLGWDIAGTVTAVGPGVTAFVVGDRVLGMPRFPAEAAGYAEEVIAGVDEIACIPSGLDDTVAAALPLVSLTAYQALVEVAAIGSGTRVLVPAAGGGVGHIAVQIAVALGASVVATASAQKTEFVRGLGAHEVLDYAIDDLASIDPVDVAIDPFGGVFTQTVLPLVRDGGVLALLVGSFDDETRARAGTRDVRLARISVVPNARSLAAIVGLVENGAVRPHVSATFPLDQAGRAQAHLDTGVLGKVVLVP